MTTSSSPRRTACSITPHRQAGPEYSYSLSTLFCSGSFATFNWDTTSETALSITTALNNAHLSDQYYNICIRRARGYCSICYSPHVVTATNNEATSFGVSATNPATDAAAQALTETLCSGITSIMGTGTVDDAANLGKVVEYWNNHLPHLPYN